MEKIEKKAVVVHSGGMDSSICLALAIEQYGNENVLSLSFTYGQRHALELDKAREICKHWNVDHKVLDIDCLSQITHNSLTNHDEKISKNSDGTPNTLVMGRNGLMARIASIHAQSLGAKNIYMGIIEVEEANSGYRDCSRKYMDIIQAALRLDFDDDKFQIKTPLVFMTKNQTMELAYESGVLHYLVEKTLSCYEGIEFEGCQKCPACSLRNEGLKEFSKAHPDFSFSYRSKILK